MKRERNWLYLKDKLQEEKGTFINDIRLPKKKLIIYTLKV